MLKIGEFSKLSRCSIRMLHHYDEIGLLAPVSVDPFTGYRYYAESQLHAVSRIAALRDMGFGLSAIREMLDCGSIEALARRMDAREAELLAQAEETNRQLERLRAARRRLKEDENMQYDVVLKTLPERKAACVRMTIPSYECVGMLWSTLVGETEPLKLVPDEPCYCAVVFHDRDYKESDVDVEAQKTVRGDYPDTEHVRFKILPAVTYASAVVKGPYHQINDANAAVAAWVRDNHYTFEGSAFNIYHVSPHETQNAEEFVTEVCYPVRRD